MGPEIGPELFGTFGGRKLNGIFDKACKLKQTTCSEGVWPFLKDPREIARSSLHCTVMAGTPPASPRDVFHVAPEFPSALVVAE